MTSSNYVTYVSVYNREDCCKERLTNYVVRVGNDPDITKNAQCAGTYSGT